MSRGHTLHDMAHSNAHFKPNGKQEAPIQLHVTLNIYCSCASYGAVCESKKNTTIHHGKKTIKNISIGWKV